MKNFACWELPEGYRLYRRVRLADDKKTLILLSAAQLVILAVMAAYAGWRGYMESLDYYGPVAFWGMMALTLVGIAVYVVAHEWTHGVWIRIFSGEPAEFGMKLKQGMFYAGSRAYFGKTAYIVIALAPLVIWGILLGMMLADCSAKYVLFLYMIQIMNVSGAVGDLYVTWLTLQAPKGVLVSDSGTDMIFYAPEDAPKDEG